MLYLLVGLIAMCAGFYCFTLPNNAAPRNNFERWYDKMITSFPGQREMRKRLLENYNIDTKQTLNSWFWAEVLKYDEQNIPVKHDKWHGPFKSLDDVLKDYKQRML